MAESRQARQLHPGRVHGGSHLDADTGGLARSPAAGPLVRVASRWESPGPGYNRGTRNRSEIDRWADANAVVAASFRRAFIRLTVKRSCD